MLKEYCFQTYKKKMWHILQTWVTDVNQFNKEIIKNTNYLLKQGYSYNTYVYHAWRMGNKVEPKKKGVGSWSFLLFSWYRLFLSSKRFFHWFYQYFPALYYSYN